MSLERFSGSRRLESWGSLVCALVICSHAAGLTFETNHLRLEISADGQVRSVRSKPDNVEYAELDSACPAAMIFRGGRREPVKEGKYAAATGPWTYRGGDHLPATAASRSGDLVTFEFGACGAKVICRVREKSDYLAFELVKMDGAGFDRVEFLRLNLRRLSCLGEWMGAVYDDRFGICLCGANPETDIQPVPGAREVLMTAAAESGVSLHGPTAILFACPAPRSGLLEIMDRVEQDFQLPRGVANRRSPVQRLSYLWAGDPTPQNIEEFIRYAKLGGFRMLLLSYTAFARGAGHFEWKASYPGGMADLQRVTAAIRAAGLKTGLHIHATKASKTDSYVTPLPDERLHRERSFHLSQSIGPDVTEIAVDENPAGCTLDADRRILKLGTELIEYQNYTWETPFRFTGCRRGRLGSLAAVHPVQSRLDLLDVDTWPAFIRFDQTTDIQDEVARRIAGIYRQTGPYDLVYFDGAEDVHEPFWYWVASAQQRVYRLLDPPPPVCESALYTHFGWHLINRANAYDAIAAPDAMKDFCRLMPCPTAAAREFDFSRIDFGWLGRFGSPGGAAGPDVYEFAASRAAAWDCPLSLHASLTDLRSNPRAEDCLAVFKIWEDARLTNQLSLTQRQSLRNVAPADAHYVPCFEQREILERILQNRGLTAVQRRILGDRREHHLFVNQLGRYELVELEEVTGLANGAVKAFAFRRPSNPADTYALVWTAEGGRRLRFSGPGVTAMRPFGNVLPGPAGEAVVGPRTYLLFSKMNLEQALRCLRESANQSIQP